MAMWKDFPAQLAQATGCSALIYSRAGSGQSDPAQLPRPLDYMEKQGVAELAQTLAGIEDAVLIGHSDGGSIALAYAATHTGLRGVIVEAAHVFCEQISVRSIEAARVRYEQGELRRRLQRYHGSNVDCAFWGWNQAWLHPDFFKSGTSNDSLRSRVPATFQHGPAVLPRPNEHLMVAN